MSTEQKLREALQALLASGGVIAEAADDELQAAIDDPDAEEIVKVQAAAVLNARQALATTEPVMANGLTEAETDASASVVGLATTEPAGMPELPDADVLFEDGKDQYGYTEYGHAFSFQRTKAYGEQCWKAGYKHGAWGGDARDAAMAKGVK